MTGLLALFIFSLCLLFLYYRDAKDRSSVSSGAWIVVAWAVIYGSRPVTEWFSGADQGPILQSSIVEGNPNEALVSLSLILAGLIALLRRRKSIQRRKLDGRGRGRQRHVREWRQHERRQQAGAQERGGLASL